MEEKPNPPAKKAKNKGLILLLALALLGGAAAGGAWLWHRWQYVSTDDAQVKGNLVTLSAKVPGRIVKLFVDEGAAVKQDQVLFELEKDDYQTALAQAAAGLEKARQELAQAAATLSLTRERVAQGVGTAEASLKEAGEGLRFSEEDALLQTDRVRKEIEQAEANGQAARARVLEAKANLENARKEYERAEELFRRQFVAETQKDAAETAWQVAQSKYQVALETEREARAQLALARANERSIVLKQQAVRISEQVLKKAQLGLSLARQERKQIEIQEKSIDLLKAKVREAEATFKLAEIRLQETAVASPISGVVSKRFAEQGQLVQQGQPVFTVNNPAEKWVVANVEETKIRRVRTGARANVEADAYPNRVFEGKVEFVGSAAISEFALLPADNPSGNFIKITHRLPVRISVSDAENRLRPGMMVVVDIEAK
jgi:membrane fusion protein (multidrug efflux system)